MKEESIDLNNLPPEFQMYFHKSQMERVKKECKGITYISHLKQKDSYFTVVRIKNDLGGKDELNFPLQVEPSRMTAKEYDFIIETVNAHERN